MGFPFQRLTSNINERFLRAGTDRDVAAMNAANETGTKPDLVARQPGWPSLQKFDNDTDPPFGSSPNPDYIWTEPASAGQTASFANASREIPHSADPNFPPSKFTVTLVAFADNAMKAKIELFQKVGNTFFKAAPQPVGLGDVIFVTGVPNTPVVGISETEPYEWQDIRMYSTVFELPTTVSGTFKIVVSFEGTNYLPTANNFNNANPAGLQFMVDIYISLPLASQTIIWDRLTSNTSRVFLGASREQAALNAANAAGPNADLVPRHLNPVWPSIQKFDNDTTQTNFSPLGGVPNPQYVWDLPTSDGQTANFAVATLPFFKGGSFPDQIYTFSVAAFADNAMTYTIELFEQVGSSFVKVNPQPEGIGKTLVAGAPNMPAVGLTETEPFNWRNIREHSTFGLPPEVPSGTRLFVFVFSFEVTNYLPPGNNPNIPNPAGLQFMIDVAIEVLD